MAVEVFIDTSGFYAQWDRNDRAHERVKAWLSFCVMNNNGVLNALTTDLHFRKAGFQPLLVA